MSVPTSDDLRLPTHNGSLTVAVLRRHHDRPVMHLGDVTLTGGEVAAQMSRYVLAFEASGAGTGTAGALLALNRPEVLYILGAGQAQGSRRTSLHPLGSADDHAYVIDDAANPAGRVGVAGEPSIPDVHAALARRGRLLRTPR